MLLNHEEIFTRISPIQIDNFNPANLTQSSYNLTIGKIINHKGREFERFTLKPQGIVNVISKEFLKIPDDVVAYATVKNGMSRKGILAINIGLIDPGYEGMVASHLINFGRDEIEINITQHFLRLTFHKINLPEINKSISQSTFYKHTINSYIQSRREETKAYIGERFLNMENTELRLKKAITKAIISDLIKYGAVLAVPIAVFSLIISSFSESKRAYRNEDLKIRIEKLEEKVPHFLEQKYLNDDNDTTFRN